MITAIIIAKNEALNIRRCLSSLSFVNEIIVVDSGSTDKTVDIAKEFTDKVFEIHDWQGYGIQKQRALSLATSEWVLHIDADEEVSDELKQSLLRVVEDNQCDACRVPIRLCFFDKILKYSSSPTRHVRFFKRNIAHFSEDIVHEKIVLPQTAKIKQLKSPLIHRSFRDISHLIEKFNRYSSCSAEIQIKSQNSPPSFLKVVMGAIWMFFRTYILQGGLWDGKEGFILSVLNAQGSFYRGIKQLYPDKLTSR